MGADWFDFPAEGSGQGRFAGTFMNTLKRKGDGWRKLWRDFFNARK